MLNIETIINMPADPTHRIGYPGLGDEIRELRTHKNYTQETLATQLKCSWMTVHRWETGRRTIHYGTLKRLVELCTEKPPMPDTYISGGIVFQATGAIREVTKEDCWLTPRGFPVLPSDNYQPLGKMVILKPIRVEGSE